MFGIFELRKANLVLLKETLERATQIGELQQQIHKLQAVKQQDTQTISKLSNDLGKAQNLVRDQTEADLLINALKALKIIPPEEKDQDYFHRAAALHNQLGALQQQNSPSAFSQQALGGLGGLL